MANRSTESIKQKLNDNHFFPSRTLQLDHISFFANRFSPNVFRLSVSVFTGVRFNFDLSEFVTYERWLSLSNRTRALISFDPFDDRTLVNAVCKSTSLRSLEVAVAAVVTTGVVWVLDSWPEFNFLGSVWVADGGSCLGLGADFDI
jgi:hypothetical protein